MADDSKPPIPSAPPTGANPAATGAQPARAAAPRPAAVAPPDIAGKTTTVASPGGAAAAKAPAPAAAVAAAKPAAPARDPDDTSPLLTRRAWIGLAWGAFSAASAAALAATARFLFPTVLYVPQQHFNVGFPNEYGIGVDERRKVKHAVSCARALAR